MNDKMMFALLVTIVISGFSLLTMIELLIVKTLGFDVITYLNMTFENGSRSEIFFITFGIIAFIVGQPIILTVIYIRALNKYIKTVFTSMFADIAEKLRIRRDQYDP